MIRISAILALLASLASAAEVELVLEGVRTLAVEVREKNVYELVVDMLPDPGGRATMTMRFLGRDVKRIAGMAFEDYPDTPTQARHHVLAMVDPEQVKLGRTGVPEHPTLTVLSGDVAFSLGGLDVRELDGPRWLRISWRDLRGIDGLDADAWLLGQGALDRGAALRAPCRRLLVPRAIGASRILTLCLASDAFMTCLAALIGLLLATAVGVTLARMCMRGAAASEDEIGSPSLSRSTLAALAGLVALTAAVGGLSWSLDPPTGGAAVADPFVLLVLLLGAGLVHAMIAGRFSLRGLFAALTGQVAALATLLLVAGLGLPWLEAWLRR